MENILGLQWSSSWSNGNVRTKCDWHCLAFKLLSSRSLIAIFCHELNFFIKEVDFSQFMLSQIITIFQKLLFPIENFFCTKYKYCCLFLCQYQCKWLPGKTCPWNELLCVVVWNVKLYSLTVSCSYCWTLSHTKKTSQKITNMWLRIHI